MSTFLWILQVVLAVKLVTTAYSHGVRPDPAKMKGTGAGRRPLLALTAAALLVIAAGLILPGALGVWAWLTPWVAVAFAVLMLLATRLHDGCREQTNLVADLVLMVLAVFLTFGRWVLAPL
jgi:hypothetical protein